MTAPFINRLEHRDLAVFIDMKIGIGSDFRAIYFNSATVCIICIYR